MKACSKHILASQKHVLFLSCIYVYRIWHIRHEFKLSFPSSTCKIEDFSNRSALPSVPFDFGSLSKHFGLRFRHFLLCRQFHALAHFQVIFASQAEDGSFRPELRATASTHLTWGGKVAVDHVVTSRWGRREEPGMG